MTALAADGWHIWISEYLATTKLILMKLDRKQVLSIIFFLCFWAHLSRKMVTLGWPVIDWHTLSSTTILCRKALNLLYPWYMYQCQYRHPCPHVKSKFKCFKVLEFQSFSEYIFSCIFIFYPLLKLLTTKVYVSHTFGDCGISGFLLLSYGWTDFDEVR